MESDGRRRQRVVGLIWRCLLLTGMISGLLAGMLATSRPAAAQTAPVAIEAIEAIEWQCRVPWLHTRSERTLSVGQQTVRLRICAPHSASGTAEVFLSWIERALPRLQDHAGFPIGGSRTRDIYILPTNEWPYPYIDGFYRLSDEVIFLHTESHEWTVVHEAAHFWANPRNFDQRQLWLIEGYAEYLTGLVMQELNSPIRPPQIADACQTLPLLEWQYSNTPTARCGYDGGAAVFNDLATEAGAAELRSAIYRLRDGSNLVTSEHLLFELEHNPTVDATSLMQGRVFQPHWNPYLDWRREQRQRLQSVTKLAAELGIAAPPLYGAINAAISDPAVSVAVEQQLDSWLPFLASAADVQQRCSALHLPCARPWLEIGDDPAARSMLQQQLAAAATQLERYAALVAEATASDLNVPPDLTDTVAAFDPAAQQLLDAAQAVLQAGRQLANACVGNEALCVVDWQTAWQHGDFAAANDQITAQQELLARWNVLARLCRGVMAACRQHVQASDATRAAVEQAMAELETLLAQATGQEAACRHAGWPCSAGWRTALRSDGLAAAQTHLAASAATLEQLTAIEQEIAPTTLYAPAPGEVALLGPLTSADLLAQARDAFAAGAVAQALDYAEQARRRAAAGADLQFWAWRVGLPALLVILALLVVLTVRVGLSQRRSQPGNDQLLEQLLAQTPQKPGRR